MTIRSGAIACRLSAVSSRVSPFSSAEPEEEKLMLSADSRFSAISKLERVRVEASKKRLMTVRPRSVGTFLIGRSATSRNDSAVSRMSSISAARKLGDSQQVFARPDVASAIALRPGTLQDLHVLLAVVALREGDLDHLVGRGRHGLARPRRPGSAARGGRGRSAPPGAPRAGGRSRPARRAPRAPCGRCRARRRRAPPRGRPAPPGSGSPSPPDWARWSRGRRGRG